MARSPKKHTKTTKKTNTRKKTPSKKTSKNVQKQSLFWRLTKLGFVAGIWGVLGLILLIFINSYNLPDIYEAMTFEKRPAVTILSEDQQILARYGETRGRFLTVDDVPEHLIQAIIAIEDRRFYSHIGIDPIGLSRAMWENVKAGAFVQGGSTLTQQLSKILFLTPEKTLQRKFNEALTALWLEYEYSKDDILFAYINRVYLGAGTYGFDAAAQRYFGKTAAQVNLSEAALLAGLLKAPSRLAPTNNPDLAEKRMRTVLSAMVDAGFITGSQAQQARNLPPIQNRAMAGSTLFFTDKVMADIQNYIGNSQQDLIVYTTLNPDIQTKAAEAIKNTIAQHGTAYDFSQAALMTIDLNGAVRAMIGGADYRKSQFNRAEQARRQVGSAFKPFVYLTAMQSLGLTPESIVMDEQRSYEGYTPQNYDDEYHGAMSLTEAFANSVNTVAAKLAYEAGIDNVQKTARKFGITASMPNDLSLALGSAAIPMKQMTTAYAMIANGGRVIEPHSIKKIQTLGGTVLFEHQDYPSRPLFAREDLDNLRYMMQQSILKGTSRRANIPNLNLYAKTGTSQDYRDAWFIGFSNHYVTAVWLGNDDNQPMKRVTGGSFPAQIWKQTMLEAHKNLPREARPLEEKSKNNSFIDGIMSIFKD